MGKTFRQRIPLLSIFLVVLILFVGLSFANFSKYNPTSNLIHAIKNEDIAEVKRLLINNTDPNKTDVTPSLFWTFLETSPQRPLTVACTVGNLEIIELLIDHGATAEYREETGFSPLRATLFYYQPNDLEIVELLLSNGAGIGLENGNYPAFYAAKMLPKVYDAKRTNGTVFVGEYDEATAIGITEIVKRLTSSCGLNITDNAGKTLVMTSIESENTYLVKYLIEEGCDLSVVDNSGKTAWDYAKETNNKDIIELLK